MSWRGVFTGALMLIGLEVVISSGQAADRFGGIFTAIATVVEHLLDPTVPAIPDLRTAGSSSSGSSPSQGPLIEAPGPLSRTVPLN